MTSAVSDACAAADTVTLTYNITYNTAPVISFGNDTTVFLCSSDSICIPYTASDVDNNIESVSILGGVGALNEQSEICFLPAATGSYQFILQVTDSCGKFDKDTINVTVDYNNPPTVNGGANQNHFLCAPQQICSVLVTFVLLHSITSHNFCQ